VLQKGETYFIFRYHLYLSGKDRYPVKKTMYVALF